ncbi:venom carboxylesterase-6-like, partial [Copidosoma floridanum]|uniref:venom carboxylesterase-6-like n=1 Tax=Copidosoma floridanum TaxID=29053 RepID=UPI000C6F76F7
LFLLLEFATNDRLLKELDANWTSIAPHLLDFNYTVPLRLHEEVAMKIRGHYLGSKPINRENARSVTKMVGDRLFVVDAEKAARMQAKANKSPVWFYYYSYRAAQSLSNALSGTEQDLGVCHADDAYLVIENHRVVPTTTESDRAMQADLTRLWVSFAENGTQAFSPSWSKVGPLDKKFKYLHISEPSEFNMDGDKNFGDKYFWNSINFDENVLKTSSSKNEL